MRRLAAVSLILLLVSCASRADRVTDTLEKHGVSPRRARCMGERLADRLDDTQLMRLKQLSALAGGGAGKLKIDDLLDQLHRDGDPRLVSAVVRAGLHCAA